MMWTHLSFTPVIIFVAGLDFFSDKQSINFFMKGDLQIGGIKRIKPR
jgi:hypothetical protein